MKTKHIHNLNRNHNQPSRSWDEYVRSGPSSTVYQLPVWRRIIGGVYGHQSYYLVALKSGSDIETVELTELEPPPAADAADAAGDGLLRRIMSRHGENAVGTRDGSKPGEGTGAESEVGMLKGCGSGERTDGDCRGYPEATPKRIAGILPLVHLKSFAFGNDLISVPFFDTGGILADDEDSERALLREAVRLARKLGARSVQLRHTAPLATLCAPAGDFSTVPFNGSSPAPGCTVQTRTHKARMLLELPGSSDALMASFKSKLRSQIRKPVKEGLTARAGRLELLDDFYDVFSVNMRDLGSPVHSKSFIRSVLEGFPNESGVCIVYGDGQPLAGSVMIGYRDTLCNPWASALRKYSRLSPNMLLYWTMLQYACDSGYRYFDFGRSSVDESTYKFKEQWGALPQPLHWYYISLDGKPRGDGDSEKSKFDAAIRVWQKLPVALTKLIGPPVRKHIGL